jgi:hypothetical protein
MHAEHCIKHGFDHVFITPNYKFKTTAKQEWMIVVEGAECPPENMKHDRRIPNLAECCKLGETQGNLCREEVIAVVLYTGPMVCISCLHV